AADKGALEIVSVGKAFPDHELRIVDEGGETLADGVVGHILLKGPSVTPGYFEAPEETAAVFQADGWLRTGDLGYLRDGELFVCGRAKDLIIINGKNFYPQDIERIAADAYGVRPDQCVAFARAGANSEECVVVAEALKRGTDVDGIDAAIKRRVRTELGVPVAEVVMIQRNSMPKTSSGKVRRQQAKIRHREGTLEYFVAAAKPAVPAPRASAPAL
ncbi:MAG: AMP-binding protein, partial [Myxococcota bacterium]